jgi:hypothetical protein
LPDGAFWANSRVGFWPNFTPAVGHDRANQNRDDGDLKNQEPSLAPRSKLRLRCRPPGSQSGAGPAIKKELEPLREKIVALEAANAILRANAADLTSRLARMEVILENKSVRVIRGAA